MYTCESVEEYVFLFLSACSRKKQKRASDIPGDKVIRGQEQPNMGAGT